MSDALEARLGHRFADRSLLQQALTHRSFGTPHSERLEFLGDAVLDCALSRLLMLRLPTAAEGELSRLRAALVRQSSLHAIALSLDLPPLLRLGSGLERAGGRQQASILADALEALIGAVHLDAGAAASEPLVERLFAAQLADPDLPDTARDAKTSLQEVLQARGLPPPEYHLTATDGPAHQQTFTVLCRVAALDIGALANGSSRRAAEQQAAAQVLQELAGEGGA